MRFEQRLRKPGTDPGDGAAIFVPLARLSMDPHDTAAASDVGRGGIPHLIHIGYPKAGATFFKAWCESREDIAFTRRGFAGHAHIEDVPNDVVGSRPGLMVSSSEALVSVFSRHGRSPRSGWPTGDPPRMSTLAAGRQRQAETCAQLARLFPTAHILVLVRGFEGAIRSLAAQRIKAGRPERWAWDPDANVQALKSYRMFMDYDRVIGLYEAAFGSERVTVLPYEMLRDDLEAYVRALCRVGGLPYRPFDPGRVNASMPGHALAATTRLSAVVRPVLDRVPGPANRVASRAYARLLAVGPVRRALDLTGRVARATPLPDHLVPADALREAFAGCADSLVLRPEVAPYAAEYLATGR